MSEDEGNAVHFCKRSHNENDYALCRGRTQRPSLKVSGVFYQAIVAFVEKIEFKEKQRLLFVDENKNKMQLLQRCVCVHACVSVNMILC